MSLYDRWRLVSIVLLVILYSTSFAIFTRGRRDRRVDKWALRNIVVATIYWTGWLIADVSRRRWALCGLDGFFLAVELLFLYNWWRRNRKRIATRLAGYKAAAIKARMAARAAAAAAA